MNIVYNRFILLLFMFLNLFLLGASPLDISREQTLLMACEASGFQAFQFSLRYSGELNDKESIEDVLLHFQKQFVGFKYKISHFSHQFSINIKCDNISEVIKIKTLMKSILDHYNVSYSSDCSIYGSGTNSLKFAIMNVIRYMSATTIEELNENNLTSISAYSKLLNQKLRTYNGDMNLQIAAKVDATSGETVLVLGSPIITTDY